MIYAERLPIGTIEVIQNFKHERLKTFYADWYKPDVMAVIAVGDFDKAAVQTLVEKHFGSLPAPTAATRRATYDVPDQPGAWLAIATDKEATSTTIAVNRKHPPRDPATEASYRERDAVP